MAYNALLIWYGNDQVAIFLQFALASQAAVKFWISGPVNIFLFSVTHIRQQILAGIYVHMAGTAATNRTAIVVQVYIVIQCHIQYTLAFKNLYSQRGLVFFFEFKGDFRHRKNASIKNI